MTYSDEIKKIQQSPFAELYEISSGPDIWRYTSYSEDVVFQGFTYEARPIQRGDWSKENQLRSVKVKLTVPMSDVAIQYVANSPVPTTTVKITRFFMDANVSTKLFEGEVSNVVVKKGVAEVDCESSTAIYRYKVPTIIHQGYCNNALFDSRCALSEVAYKVTATGATVSSLSIVAGVFSGFADGYFTWGRVETVYGDTRLITNHVGNTLTLHVPFDYRLVTGATVYAWPGCDKAPATCKDKFNNFPNFIGFPHIPSSNPAVWGANEV